MNDNDIKTVLNLLKTSIRRTDWECVCEAVEYLDEFSSSDISDEDDTI